MRIHTHSNPFSCTNHFEKLDAAKIFPEFNGKIDFEIGFGQSSFIRTHAQTYPNRLIVGIDVRKKAVSIMQERVDQNNIKNIFLTHGNGSVCLEEMFSNNSIDNIFIFHPDPWRKHRHHNRRLINSSFLLIAQNKLKLNGRIYVSTDVDFLWDDILKTFESCNNFNNVNDVEFWTNYYKSRWHDICQTNNRPIFYATFSLKK